MSYRSLSERSARNIWWQTEGECPALLPGHGELSLNGSCDEDRDRVMQAVFILRQSPEAELPNDRKSLNAENNGNVFLHS